MIERSASTVIDLTDDHDSGRIAQQISDDSKPFIDPTSGSNCHRELRQEVSVLSTSNSITGFADQRRNRRDDVNWILFRHPRGMARTEIKDWLSSDRDRQTKTIPESAVRVFIEKCLKDFELQGMLKEIVTRSISEHILIDQGQYNCCSYVAYCHLIWLVNGTGWNKNWVTTWKVISPRNESFEDIGSMLDALQPPNDRLVYVPFRSLDDNENYFNKNILPPESLLIDNPYERIKYFFEALLDRHIPIAFNHLSHSRVAIAYNDNSILCIDSFPRDYEEIHEYIHWCGGLSVVNKQSVYEWVRDAVYFK